MFADCNAYFIGLDADEVADIIKRSKEEGVEIIVAVNMDMESSVDSVKIAQKHNIVYSAIGINPLKAVTIDSALYRELKELGQQEKVAAISQIGL
ncbi:TatD family hydrolase, partial [Chloroflexota bacterium]